MITNVRPEDGAHIDTVGGATATRRGLLAGLAGAGALAAVLAASRPAHADPPPSGRVLVEDHYPASTTTDQEAWQAALNAAAALPGPSHVIASGASYHLTQPLNLTGFQDLTIEGLGPTSTTLRVDPARATALNNLFVIGGTAATARVTLRNLGFHGGMLSPEPEAHARDGAQPRPFPAGGYLRTAIYALGADDPTASGHAVVDGVTIENCRFYGTDGLPILLKGVRNVVVRDCYARRCLDIGFTFCTSVHFIGNRVEWCADNGVSLSRGCSEVVCVGNTIIGSFAAGIFAGGFGDDPGPSQITIVANTVLDSALCGIQLTKGTTDALVQANVIDGVLRGYGTWESDGNGPIYGVGVMVAGMPLTHSEATSSGNQADYERLAQRIQIIGNTISNADRAGVLMHGTDQISIIGNTVHNPGSATYVDGVTPIPPDATYRNTGIGPFAPAAAGCTNTTIALNQIADDRGGVMIYGVIGAQGVSTLAVGNTIVGAAQTSGGAGFRAPALPTVSRPTAASVGIGGNLYDTTLHKPIWSDGSAWRDAAGAVV
ncbi:right-handed parallel beta-helix repeat-containing protein [Occultella aeris]|uniref:Right handed beta helix domain-containing protein n=1 Tax=Occultella aeris TaxID=2761496 RepID=A0A7M4DEX6_9MICO|nr:right-handed parallel beta-helix repeat-containing protein [Occultella aeris]VZO35469.1 hypothetical protein HALOF300_00667 [Occultella aeris]